MHLSSIYWLNMIIPNDVQFLADNKASFIFISRRKSYFQDPSQQMG